MTLAPRICPTLAAVSGVTVPASPISCSLSALSISWRSTRRRSGEAESFAEKQHGHLRSLAIEFIPRLEVEHGDGERGFFLRRGDRGQESGEKQNQDLFSWNYGSGVGVEDFDEEVFKVGSGRRVFIQPQEAGQQIFVTSAPGATVRKIPGQGNAPLPTTIQRPRRSASSFISFAGTSPRKTTPAGSRSEALCRHPRNRPAMPSGNRARTRTQPNTTSRRPAEFSAETIACRAQRFHPGPDSDGRPEGRARRILRSRRRTHLDHKTSRAFHRGDRDLQHRVLAGGFRQLARTEIETVADLCG